MPKASKAHILIFEDEPAQLELLRYNFKKTVAQGACPTQST